MGTELAFVIVFPNEISEKVYSSTVLLLLLVLEYSFANFGDHWHQANGEIGAADPRRGGGNEQFHRKCHGVLHGRALRPVPSLVGAQPGRDVVTERVGQREGTHHRQARPVAEQGDTRRGVADQADTSARPRRYLYPADRVEVQVVGDADAVHQLGHAPPSAGICGGQQPLVLVEVAVVEVCDLWGAEHERAGGVATCRMDGQGSTRLVVHDEFRSRLTVQRQRGDVDAEVL